MQGIKPALDETRGLYQTLLGQPAPTVGPDSFVPFPFGVDPIEHAQLELNGLRQMAEQVAFAPRAGSWLPQADSFLTRDEFIVRVEVPGVEREDLKVFIIGGECVVRGNRKAPDLEQLRPMAMERPWGPFERRFVLPVGSRIDEMKARTTNGVLELRIPVEGIDVPREQKVDVD